MQNIRIYFNITDRQRDRQRGEIIVSCLRNHAYGSIRRVRPTAVHLECDPAWHAPVPPRFIVPLAGAASVIRGGGEGL